MNNVFDHPSEEMLERFLMNKCADSEIATVETHVLACESCVTRMEVLEDEIGEIKLVLQQWQRQQAIAATTAPTAVKEQDTGSWLVRKLGLTKLGFSWLPMPAFALAGGMAVLALGTFILPQVHLRSAAAADVSITAMRGSESASVPAHRPIRMHLGADGLAAGPVIVQIVDGAGTSTWEGRGTVQSGSVNVLVAPINELGTHLARLYTIDGTTRGTLLREYSLAVQ